MAEKILLVEDDTKIARFVELELAHEGYSVVKAFDGRQGLELAESGGFDLMLLDIILGRTTILPSLLQLKNCLREFVLSSRNGVDRSRPENSP